MWIENLSFHMTVNLYEIHLHFFFFPSIFSFQMFQVFAVTAAHIMGWEEVKVLFHTVLLACNCSGVFFVADVTHLVDLSKEKNMTVTIHLKGWPSLIPLMSEPMCLICKDPRTCDRVLTLTSGAVYRISFLCKDLSRLRVTAEKGIGMTKVA